MDVDVSVIESLVRAGERLDEAVLRKVAGLDVLELGMLADQARRRSRGDVATFARIWTVEVSGGWVAAATPDAAVEIRLRGLPASLDEAQAVVRQARAQAGGRLVSGFSLAELMARADAGWGAAADVLRTLRDAGLDAVAEAPIDRLDAGGAWVEAARTAGLAVPCLTVDAGLGPDRVALLLAARRLQDAGAGFQAVAPLPRTLSTASPTTGYDDVRAVALARLVLDNVPHVQVSWALYGPKLAQVALTFGADDIDEVSPGDDETMGWRRAPAEDVRRNIAAAGWTAVERDGRFAVRAAAGDAGGAA